MSHFYRLSFELPEPEQDWLSLELFARGADGVSVEEAGGVVRMAAYCPDPLPVALERAGESWSARGIRLLSSERCESRDWLAAYRAASVPVRIGRRFVVDPREPEEVPAAGPGEGGEAVAASEQRVLLRVPARRAFGTGSHPSTSMVMEWLESLEVEGRSVLDLGTGTGILSMAALSLGAASAVGLDIDPVACFVASEIRRLNRQGAVLAAGGLSCLGTVRFDLVLVNILPSEWLAEAGGLARVLADDGVAILSGLPSDQVEGVCRRLEASGLETIESRHHGEWSALLVRRVAP